MIGGLLLVHPTTGGVRGIDAFGSGAFRAQRRHGELIYEHLGVDFVAAAGSPVVAPTDAMVARIGWPYSDDTNYRLVELTVRLGLLRLFYVLPYSGLDVGNIVSRGQPIGHAQDIAARYGTAMTNHVHMELELFPAITTFRSLGRPRTYIDPLMFMDEGRDHDSREPL